MGAVLEFLLEIIFELLGQIILGGLTVFIGVGIGIAIGVGLLKTDPDSDPESWQIVASYSTRFRRRLC